ncbi:putative membrane protein [Labilithrix luteola]|uniref:Putative membrane protein n=1 Tax=Labilithrix luteola TaxID=1391654 RepID=A0A0K1QAJ1_9BACT|nr:ATP-grasp domain-containing protein [Labilithrix luteola]AKV02697.1 putative membrane protein [Labilithrix luteola]
MLLLLPSDPLHPRRPDEHFSDEGTAARNLGHQVMLVDHDALCRADGAAEGVARVSVEGSVSDALYRGWMLRSDQYAAFEEALAKRGVTLRTNARQYQQAHELPGWYAPLASVTPESVWTRGSSSDDFRAICRQLGSGPAVLRDYSKSMKHYWHEAAFIQDVANEDAAWRIAQRFLELRDDAFVGGFVLRRFESLRADEIRTWWVDGACVLQTPHPDSRADAPLPEIDLGALAKRIPNLRLPFVTVDLALRDDGVWRVIELGDGQVSDRPRTTPAEAFLRAVGSG